MQQPLLAYSHVEVCYNGRPAVSDVSFTLDTGEILGIVGESGSGKSTLVKAAMGLLGPSGMVTRGDIFYNGCAAGESKVSAAPAPPIDLLALPKGELRALCGPELGMVFQDCLAALTPVRRIGEQMYEAVAAHSKTTREESDTRAIEVLRRLNFADPARVLSSYPFELSGGMGQLVGIALATLLEPNILLADELTSALDVVSQKKVIGELLAIREQQGTAMVVVTHNIGVVRAMADNVLVLREGCVEDFGPTAHVLNASKSVYTRMLIDAAPRLRKVGS